MRVFVNKISGKRFIVLDGAVVEGADAFYIKNVNISLPKEKWEEKEDADRTDRRRL